MPASRFSLASPLDRPPSTLLRTGFDTSFVRLLRSYSGLLRVQPAANAMPLSRTLGSRRAMLSPKARVRGCSSP
jgi:hypothetical protein